MPPIVLFDIDLTLVRTNGAGRHAMDLAFAELFGRKQATAGISFDGRTDRAIFSEAITRHTPDRCDDDTLAVAFAAYLSHLPRELARLGGEVLPGVGALLDALDAAAVPVGLATGNIRAGAEAKLGYFDLWRRFPAGGFGDHTAVRAELVVAGIDEVARLASCDPAPALAIVLGDTPLDIAAAHAAGARALGVATGRFSIGELLVAGADWAVADLSNTALLLDILTSVPAMSF